MRSKKLKIFVSILLIIVIIFMQCGNVLAMSMPPPPPGIPSQGADEAPGKPVTIPNDDPQTKPSEPVTPSEPSEPSGPRYETKEHPIKIEGNIYEDLGYTKPGTAGGSGSEDDQWHKDDERTRTFINGAVVKLIDSSENVVATQVTGEDGSYSFSPSPGTYSVELQYGNIDGLDLNNTNLIKDVLNYNGHDYITVSTPSGGTEGSSGYIDVDKVETILAGKGVAQVFLLIDCSKTARTTMVNINGETKSRLEVIVDAARELIDELMNSGENIKVGLIFFSGVCYRGASLRPKELVKDGMNGQEYLNKALDEILANDWWVYNTNVLGALDKAYESFHNNDKDTSNRYIVILSDGITTSNGNVQIYKDMSYEEMMNAYNEIIQTTRQKILDLREGGAKIFSIMVKTDVESDNEWVKAFYDKPISDVFYSSQDGQEIVDVIQEDLEEYIIETTEEKEYSSESTVITGYEDSKRRKEVDENFKTFKYDNTIIFDQIDSYNATEEDKEQATELSEKTYMIVKAGSYSIESVPNPSTIYEYDDEGNVEKIIHHVASSYSGQDFVLAKRPAMSLKLTVTATAFRIKLADGQVLLLDTREIGSDVPLIEYMDDEIAHGATIDVQYQINIKNDSSIQCNYLELVNYLPQGFVFAKSSNLLTKEGTNGDFGWVEASVNYLYDNGYISKDTKTAQQGKRMSTIKLDYPNDGFYITPRWGI